MSGLVIDPLDSNTVYAGTDIGVYRTTNGGSSWAPFGTGLPAVAVFDMAIQKTFRVLRIATHGRGIWEIAIPSADLSITKTDTPDPVVAGGVISYTISSTNNGPSDAQDVVITDVIPAGTTFVGAQAPGATSVTAPAVGATGTVTATWAGATTASTVRTLTLQVRTCPGGSCTAAISNTATTSSPTSDPVSANNSATAVTTLQAQSDLAVTSTHTPDPAGAGSATLTYTLTVTNAGPSVDPNPILTQTLPAGWTVVSATPSQGSCVGATTGVATCNLGPLGAPQGCAPPLGTSATVTVVVQVPLLAATGTYGVTTTVLTGSCLPDPNTANNTVTDPTRVDVFSDVTLTKTDAPDPVVAAGRLAYTLTVTNLGPSQAYGVKVTDQLPAGQYSTRFVSVRAPLGFTCTSPYPGTPGGQVSCTAAAPLDPGVYTIGITVTAPPVCGAVSPTIVNNAQVTITSNDPVPTNNIASASTVVLAKPCFLRPAGAPTTE